MESGFHKLSWRSAVRIALFPLLFATIAVAFVFLPIEKILKDFLLWVKQDLGPCGPLVMAVAYIPLTILAVPASVLTVGGGYLFGLPVGFLADSMGATLGATAAFIIGRTIGRAYVLSKLENYPKFQAVTVAIQRSGFKIIVLLRLVPFLPYTMINYLLSVTSVSLGEYMLASWLGMVPLTLALVYLGTTLKDLSDVTCDWNEASTSHWIFIIVGFGISVILMVWISKIAKDSLDKALTEQDQLDSIMVPAMLPTVEDTHTDLDLPNSLVISTYPLVDDHEDKTLSL